ncbi:MAG: endonuclease [Candidatus Bathyarchaeota archaeon]|jgi:Holliday junction resolvase
MSLRDLADSKPKKKKKKFTRTLTRKQIRRMKKRGYDAERELVKKFREVGFDALRVPVSAPSREPLPDVFAINEGAIVACEVKSQERYAYYKTKQVEKLFEFLDIHCIYPKRYAVLAAKFKYRGWYFEIAEKPGDFSIKLGEGLRFRELVERIEAPREN